MSNKKVQQQNSGFLSLPERIEKIYYTHGLFCSSHPVPVICFASFIIILCCYPLVNVPLPGNTPQQYVTPLKDYKIPSNQNATLNPDGTKPRWFEGPPMGYVLQIVTRSAVFPSQSQQAFGNSLRIPIKLIFDVLEVVRNYQHKINDTILTIDDICLHVSESLHHKTAPGILPHYGCLILSSTNFWKQDFNLFLEDSDLMKTILDGDGKLTESFPHLKDILFGILWKDTGVNKLVGKPKPFVAVQAITIILSHYEVGFVEGLHRRLHSAFSIVKEEKMNSSEMNKNITHVYFHDQYNLIEFIPLIFTYIILFLYIYFSVRKIELVKSKLGMAFSAVVTVISSLCMSIGICTWFGFTFTLGSGEIYLKEIFPYLVVIIGLENILVLTKSVVSTSVHLDVKVRVAQGLSKEGWSITKNLCTEIAILTFGFFTFIPDIQEFCMFAVVGLLSDFFLQLGFFATVLSIDIRRMELSDLQKQSLHQGIQPPQPEHLNHMFPLFQCPVINAAPKAYLKKSRSSSRLNNYDFSSISHLQQQGPRIVTAQYNTQALVKVPKRVRLAYFWARCRIFQRAFMITFVVWLILLFYKSGVVEHYTTAHDPIDNPSTMRIKFLKRASQSPRPLPTSHYHQNISNSSSRHRIQMERKLDISVWHSHRKAIFAKLRHRNAETWKQLSYMHWPTLFGYYNISIQGRYVSILPAIPLSVLIDSNEVVHWHHGELDLPSPSDHFHTEKPYDPSDEKAKEEDENDLDTPEGAIYPSSPIEMVLTFVLAIPSVIFIVYMMIVLYRCICSRNYAEWRSSWSQETTQTNCDVYTQLVMEAMPIVLEGHPQEIECMTTDGMVVVSSCLSGQLRIWDSSSGECLTVIDRRRGLVKQKSRVDHDADDIEDFVSDYESGSPPSRYDILTERNRKHLSAPSVLCALDANVHNKIMHAESPVNEKGVQMINSFSQDAIASMFLDDENFDSPRKQHKELFVKEPNLTSTIMTNFSKMSARHPNPTCFKEANCFNDAYDFSQFDKFYDELSSLNHKEAAVGNKQSPLRLSEVTMNLYNNIESPLREPHAHDESASALAALNPVWCLDCQDNLVAAGCSSGRIELWDSMTGDLKCVHDDGTGLGVTGICIVGSRLVAARLHGGLDFLELKSGHSYSQHSGTPVASTHRRMHVRQGSGCSSGCDSMLSWDDDIICKWVQTARAHQQPITELRVEGGRAVTGSQDHSLKVFRVEDAACQLTLHGHHGPISALFIDKFSPMTAASGAQDGAICLWDLLTGACICRLEGHDGAVAAVTYTAAYVLSAGIDTRLLVWERFQGHLLNTIYLQHCYCSSMVMLTDNLLLTARQGSLVVWDIRIGEPVRIVRLGHSDQSIFVRQIQHVGNAVVCDYGNQLRVVQFPTIVEKGD